MTSREARRAFLDFFASRHHRVVPSSPLVLPGDPTLLFANAGMNQFKDVFTGRERRDYTRAASSQKCMRVSGKHNDLEMVGRTPRHHTFFEMLGNFSFGDYFKDEAITLAWELATGVYGLPEDRLWATVFGGSDRVGPDEEAFALWRNRVGIPEERILRLGEKDNFWQMGETGPCGPCSEIHFDLGADLTSVEGPSTPATDEVRFIEIWNLVFMQFEQHADGRMTPLPAPSIDTGMGLERVTAVLQGKRSNYETDLFRPILEAASRRAGVRYGSNSEIDFSLRVIADHARALCFLVTDGVVPANDKRGYVLRRVLRRAIRHGRKLGLDGPFLDAVVPAVLETLDDVYPELIGARDAILEVARREEERFAETIATGLQLLDTAIGGLAEGGPRIVPGSELFRLYDTYGLPLDLARDLAEERGAGLDEAGFESELARQRARAQASWKTVRTVELGAEWASITGTVGTVFEGYRTTRLDSVRVLAIIGASGPTDSLAEGQEGEIILDATPFYAEAGGQVGDTGWLVGGEGRAEVEGTWRPAEGLIAHRVRIASGVLAKGDRVCAEVDDGRRNAIRRNHTATHLLHAALREVVGTHVKQAGSLVAPDRLRFDFSHFSGLTDRALVDIESLVNRKILENLEVTTEMADLDEAVRSGAMALFGEKYGDRVRVVRAGDFSVELCGGTHCARTGEIGLLKIVQERGTASGVRRVEATTGVGSLERFRDDHAVVRALEELLSVGRDDVITELQKRFDRERVLQRELEGYRLKLARNEFESKIPEVIAGVKVITGRVDGLGPQESRVLADSLRQRLGSGIVVLGRADEEKAYLLAAVTADLQDRYPAGSLVRELAKVVGGGGGGKKDLAEAGGKEPSRLGEALGTSTLSRILASLAGKGG
jgi:alanyl-tRNA synthetase